MILINAENRSNRITILKLTTKLNRIFLPSARR